jgi:hypothetical protein
MVVSAQNTFGGLRIRSACNKICLEVPYARENVRNECAHSYCVDIPAAHNPGRMWKVGVAHAINGP